MAKRRRGTIPQRVRLTQEITDLIDDYQKQHKIASFSATIEYLARLGLEQSPAEALAPIVVSAVRQSVRREVERLIKLQIYGIVEAGVGQRFAGMLLRDLSLAKDKNDPGRYDRIKQAAIVDVRKRLARDNVAEIIQDLYMEFAPEVDDDGSNPR